MPRSRRRRSRRARSTSQCSRGRWLLLGGVGVVALVGVVLLLLGGRRRAAPPAALLADTAADTVVVDPVEVNLGRVPLTEVVPVQAKIINHSPRVVSLGKPTVETLEGC